MAKDTMSILGLYRIRPDIFASMVMPSVELDLNRDMVINNILMECAEYEILYTDPDFMKWAIGEWSRKEHYTWEKLWETTQFEYDPISNYDRTENWTDKRTIKAKNTPKSTITYSDNGYENAGLITTQKVENGGTNESESTDDVTRNGRAYGNIGITTTQQMIEQEREISRFNIIDMIIDSFKERFCLLIY